MNSEINIIVGKISNIIWCNMFSLDVVPVVFVLVYN